MIAPMRYAFLAACFVAVATSSTLAGEDCTCRAAGGIEIPEGETICLKTASGSQLARCERVLNNTSWTFLNTPCPTARLSPIPAEPAAVAASATPDKVIVR